MRLSLDHRTDLALRAVRTLHAHGTRVRSRELAPEVGTTTQYLPQVLRPLVRASWIDSEPGPTGGYRLAIDPDEVSLLALIELMEGPTTPGTCALRGGPCNDSGGDGGDSGDDTCSLHDAWQSARDALLTQLALTPVGTGATTATTATTDNHEGTR